MNKNQKIKQVLEKINERMQLTLEKSEATDHYIKVYLPSDILRRLQASDIPSGAIITMTACRREESDLIMTSYCIEIP